MDRLPDVLLKKILGFVGHAKDFQQCEHVCKTFHRILSQDEVWQNLCVECQDACQSRILPPLCPPTYREKALVFRALERCYYWQRQTEPIILTEISVSKWKDIVDETVLDHYGDRSDSYRLRGDTSAVLMTLVERCVVTQLERALKIAQERDPSNPCVAMDDLKLQDFMHSMHMEPSTLTNKFFYPHQKAYSRRNLLAPAYLDGRPLHYASAQRIIRKLAYQAGITKMDTTAFGLTWDSMLHLILNLMHPCIFVIKGIVDKEEYKRPTLDQSWETMWSIPPKSVEAPHDYMYLPVYNHTIVPQQIEDAAEKLGIVHRVYGEHVWHVESDASDKKTLKEGRDREVAEAKAQYDWYEENDKEENFVYFGLFDADEDEDEEPITLSDDDSEEFSVWPDDSSLEAETDSDSSIASDDMDESDIDYDMEDYASDISLEELAADDGAMEETEVVGDE